MSKSARVRFKIFALALCLNASSGLWAGAAEIEGGGLSAIEPVPGQNAAAAALDVQGLAPVPPQAFEGTDLSAGLNEPPRLRAPEFSRSPEVQEAALKAGMSRLAPEQAGIQGVAHAGALDSGLLQNNGKNPATGEALAPGFPSAPAPEAAFGRGRDTVVEPLAQLSQGAKPGSEAGELFDGAMSKALKAQITALLLQKSALERQQPISKAWVDKKQARRALPEEQRLRDAVQTTGFSRIALNQEIIRGHNPGYTLKLPTGVIVNQNNSGRCWVFAALNVLRSRLIAQGRVSEDFKFSANYLFFFDLLEQANRYLNTAVGAIGLKASGADIPKAALQQVLANKSAVSDGGWFEYFQFLVAKYGLVPESAMPETASSKSDQIIFDELWRSMAQSVNEMLSLARANPAEFLKKARALQELALSRAWEILATHLGAPPQVFEHRQDAKAGVKEGLVEKTGAKITAYTPIEFARNFVKFNPDEYVAVGSYPGEKRGAVYAMANSAVGVPGPEGGDYDVKYLSVSVERLEELMIAAITGGYPVWIAVDVLKDVDYATGIMHPGIYLKDAIYGFSKKEKPGRRLSRAEATWFQVQAPDHAMVAVAVDQPEAKAPPVKVGVENTWGKKAGDKGMLHMYRAWWRQNLYEIIVPKALLSAEEKQAFKHPQIVSGD